MLDVLLWGKYRAIWVLGIQKLSCSCKGLWADWGVVASRRVGYRVVHRGPVSYVVRDLLVGRGQLWGW